MPLPPKYSLSALRSELKTLALHGSIFFAVALLPQRAHFFAFRLLARLHPLLLDVHSAAASLQRHDLAQAEHPAHVARRIALHQIVAYADFYLILFYGQRWFRRNVRVCCPPLPRDAAARGAFFFTPHYGQGVWALYYLKQHQLPLTRLHAPPAAQTPPGHYLAHWLARWRTARLEKLVGVPSIEVGGGGTVERMRQRLCEQQMPVLAMPDAPVQPGQRCIEVQLLGRPCAFAHGVLALAVREQVPVYIHTMAIDLRSGLRHLHVQGPFIESDSQQLAQRLADIATRAILHDPYAWHLWPWHVSAPDE